jgi:hypothetical protein
MSFSGPRKDGQGVCILLYDSWAVNDKAFRGFFDFILGFTGTSVVPRIVMLAILRFLNMVYMHKEPLWGSFASTHTFLDHRILTHTPVVLIYHDTITGGVVSRQVIYSTPQARPWGLLPRCGDPGCRSLPGSFHINGGRHQKKNHPSFQVKCLECNWKSEWLARPSWINEIDDAKFFFWNEYPLTEEQRQYFLYETVRIREERKTPE